MISNRCFQREELLDYLQGFADVQAATMVEDHVEGCSSCEAEMESLEKTGKSPDFGLDGLSRVQSFEDFSSESRIEEVVDQIKRQGPGSENAAAVGASSSTSAEPFQPGTVLGNYQIKELVGCGGMARVYRAEHLKLKKEVAIKILSTVPGGSGSSFDRVEREIQTIGKLDHPSIVTATDAGEHDGATFLVTEFVDGLDLKKIVDREKRLSIADACQIVRLAAYGISVAHSEGFIHRDIKPSNLMLDKSGSVKILDFGLVRYSHAAEENLELTTVGQLLGTLDYMAPEQAENANSADHKSDVYSLAATLFCLISGRPPYATAKFQSPLEKLRLLANHKPPKIKTLLPEVSSGLASIIDQCLSKDPSERLPSALHLAEALEPYCQPSDLQGLIASAVSKPQPTESHRPQGGATAHAIKNTRGGGRSGIWRNVALAFFFFGFIALSIILIIRTQQGEIVIQSDTANVTAKILKNGKHYKNVVLKKGTNSTVLFAGKYEVVIDAPSDQIEINQSGWEIKRGEKVVATVTKKAKTGMFEGTSEMPAGKGKTGLLYEGKSLDEWFAVVENEVSNKAAEEASVGINRIAQTARKFEYRKPILKRILALDRNHRFFRDAVIGIKMDRDDAKWIVNNIEPGSSASKNLAFCWIYRSIIYSRTRDFPGLGEVALDLYYDLRKKDPTAPHIGTGTNILLLPLIIYDEVASEKLTPEGHRFLDRVEKSVASQPPIPLKYLFSYYQKLVAINRTGIKTPDERSALRIVRQQFTDLIKRENSESSNFGKLILYFRGNEELFDDQSVAKLTRLCDEYFDRCRSGDTSLLFRNVEPERVGSKVRSIGRSFLGGYEDPRDGKSVHVYGGSKLKLKYVLKTLPDLVRRDGNWDRSALSKLKDFLKKHYSTFVKKLSNKNVKSIYIQDDGTARIDVEFRVRRPNPSLEESARKFSRSLSSKEILYYTSYLMVENALTDLDRRFGKKAEEKVVPTADGLQRVSGGGKGGQRTNSDPTPIQEKPITVLNRQLEELLKSLQKMQIDHPLEAPYSQRYTDLAIKTRMIFEDKHASEYYNSLLNAVWNSGLSHEVIYSIADSPSFRISSARFADASMERGSERELYLGQQWLIRYALRLKDVDEVQSRIGKILTKIESDSEKEAFYKAAKNSGLYELLLLKAYRKLSQFPSSQKCVEHRKRIERLLTNEKLCSLSKIASFYHAPIRSIMMLEKDYWPPENFCENIPSYWNENNYMKPLLHRIVLAKLNNVEMKGEGLYRVCEFYLQESHRFDEPSKKLLLKTLSNYFVAVEKNQDLLLETYFWNYYRDQFTMKGFGEGPKQKTQVAKRNDHRFPVNNLGQKSSFSYRLTSHGKSLWHIDIKNWKSSKPAICLLAFRTLCLDAKEYQTKEILTLFRAIESDFFSLSQKISRIGDDWKMEITGSNPPQIRISSNAEGNVNQETVRQLTELANKEKVPYRIFAFQAAANVLKDLKSLQNDKVSKN